MNKKIFAVLVFLLLSALFLSGCSADASAGTSESDENEEVVESEVVVEETPETANPTSTPTQSPTEVPTPTPTELPTATPTITATQDWRAAWGDRYWTPEQIVELLWDTGSCFLQFFWDSELPDEEDPHMPEFPITLEWWKSPPEGTTRNDVDLILVEYAEELSVIPANYICDRLYTWILQGYGWPVEPNSDERFDTVFMLNGSVYNSIISDPVQEPYCTQFSLENKEETMLLINNPELFEEWLQNKETTP